MVLSKKYKKGLYYAFLSTLDSFRILITLPLLIISRRFLFLISGVEDDWRKSCN